MGVDDNKLQPEEVLLEAKDEHKGDRVEMLQEGGFYNNYYIIIIIVLTCGESGVQQAEALRSGIGR